jgi:hypothetical protein
MRLSKKFVTIAGAILIAGSAAACSPTSATPAASSAASQEASAQAQDSNNLVTNQPVPVYQYSQARQTLINVEDIEAKGENTTSFGVSNNGNLVWSCSSIGMPVPADAQLTNPSQQEAQPNGGGYRLNSGDNVLPQMDPTGDYTGDTTGTNTLCVGPGGKDYVQYWEGYTDAVSGPASWVNGHVVLQGAPDPISSTPTSKG